MCRSYFLRQQNVLFSGNNIVVGHREYVLQLHMGCIAFFLFLIFILSSTSFYLKSIMFNFWLCLRLPLVNLVWQVLKGWYEYVGPLGEYVVVLNCCRAAWAWSLLYPHIVSNGQHDLNNSISVCPDRRACVANTSTSFFLILSSPLPIQASLIGGKLRWRKPSMSVLHSLLFLLCACFTPPLCAHWTLCALWPLSDYFSGILAFTFF